MEFGLVGALDQAAFGETAGFDFLEIATTQLLNDAPPPTCGIPILAANGFLPDGMRITGPEVFLTPVREHVGEVCERAEQMGIKTILFDAGAARNVPEGFDRKQARRQIVEFLRTALPYCARHGAILVCQPLDPVQSNTINTLPEAMQYVWEVDHPNFQGMLDAGHFLSAVEPMENLRDAMPWIRYVHVPDDRRNLRSIFSELKRGKYDGQISVVHRSPEPARELLEFLKQQWAGA
jgi:sugar phosphate isomerase/epimerase